MIHLDIKPENFILRPNGDAVLLDFGFARHERYPDLLAEELQFAAGSGPYVSPEQLQDDRSDPRSDLFALGVLLYQLATGGFPFGEPLTLTGMSESLSFGPEYLIPKPFDPRLIVMIAPAVAKAAMDSGVATHPITDFDAYRAKLTSFVYHSGLLMQPIFTAAKKEPKRIVYAEGEDERVLRAVQVVVDEKLANPILVGRPAVLARRIERFGLRLKPDVDFETINPESDERYRDYWMNYYELTQRKGVSLPYAQTEMRRRPTLIGAMMIHRGDADGMICGTFGTHATHAHGDVPVQRHRGVDAALVGTGC